MPLQHRGPLSPSFSHWQLGRDLVRPRIEAGTALHRASLSMSDSALLILKLEMVGPVFDRLHVAVACEGRKAHEEEQRHQDAK